MTRRTARALVAVLSIALPAAAGAQEKPTREEIAKLQQIMMESMAPGPEHERLAKLVGRWTQEVRMWPEPGAEPMTFTGNVENRMILGGRFLVSEGTAGEGAMQVSSMTILGFDRRNGWYTSAGYDTWGTYHVAAHGGFDAARNAIVMSGSDSVPSANHTQTWDFVLRTVDADTYVWEIVFTDSIHTKGGPPFKMVEITFRRRS
jgi:hypothetical protein